MLVTINTDASFIHKLQKGSYAFWAISNNFKETRSGAFKESVKNSSEAEFKCIINAVHVILKKYTGITRIIINTDALIVIKAIARKSPGSSLYNLTCKFLEMTKMVPVELRHVKAHSDIKDARSYVNEWCDTNAKKALKEAIKRENESKHVQKFRRPKRVGGRPYKGAARHRGR